MARALLQWAVMYKPTIFAGLALVLFGCNVTSMKADDGDGGAPQKHACVFTESSFYRCLDSDGSNPPRQVCNDSYASFEDCKADNNGGSETSDDCYYERDDTDHQWIEGSCADVQGPAESPDAGSN